MKQNIYFETSPPLSQTVNVIIYIVLKMHAVVLKNGCNNRKLTIAMHFSQKYIKINVHTERNVQAETVCC